MANRLRGEVEVNTRSARMVFCLDANALCALEETFAVATIQELADRLGNSPSVRDLRTVVHLGLQAFQPDATEADAGDVITLLGLPGATELVIGGFNTLAADSKAPATNGAAVKAGGAPAKRSARPRPARITGSGGSDT